MTKSMGVKAAQAMREELLRAGDKLDATIRYLADHAQFATRLGAHDAASDYMDAFWIVKRAVDQVHIGLG